MNLQQMEQAILATLLVDRGGINIVKPELTEDKFSFGPEVKDQFRDAHRLIYRAMLQIPGRVDVLSISSELGDNLERVGGMSYLQFLSNACLPQLGIRSTEGLPQWVIAVDTGGRLRQLGDVLEGYSRMFDDFQTLISNVDDVDTFAADLVEKVNRIVLGSTSTQYKHITTATAGYRRVLEDEARGKVLSYYPVGWPSFERFSIPPQSSLMTISGMTSVGKTQLMLQLALGVAIQIKAQDVPGVVVINSYEMVGWRNARRLAACLAGVNYQGARVKDEDSVEYRAMNEALDFVDTLPLYYDDADMTTPQIAMQCVKIMATEGPIRFLGLDYAEEVPDENKQGSEELRVSGIFRGGKRLSQATGMCYCILSQVSDISQFPNGIVPCNRLRYSRGATNASDVICYVYNVPQMRLMRIPFVFHEDLGEDCYAYVLIQKHRDGKLGAFPLEWTPDITRFRDLSLGEFGNTQLYRNLDKLGYVNGRFVRDDF